MIKVFWQWLKFTRSNVITLHISGLPLDHKFPRFKQEEDGNTDGFSPAKPKTLMSL